jgi:hypothetical protein
MHRIASANNIKILTDAPDPAKKSAGGLAPPARSAESAAAIATRAGPAPRNPR